MSKALFSKPLRRKTERFPIPEIDAEAYLTLQEMTGDELLLLRKKYGSETADPDFGAECLSLVLVDDEGKRLFDSPEECKDHITHLSVSVLDRLQLAALKLSGLSGRVAEDGKPKN